MFTFRKLKRNKLISINDENLGTSDIDVTHENHLINYIINLINNINFFYFR